MNETRRYPSSSKMPGIPIVIAALLCLTLSLHGQTVTVNPAVQYQTFEGWGVSICWWGNQIGRWSEQNRNALIEYVVNPDTGLGYNVFRFNIGGGENPSHTHMSQFRDMPGYEPSQGVWDWNGDIYQRQVLQRLLDRGKALGQNIIVEAFSNSPPYWMTISGCAAGASSAGNNLSTNNYNLFADYLTEVVKHYRDTWGITFRTLEPLNEPSASWWVSGNTQEGCTFQPGTQPALIEAVGKSLAAKGLTATTISAPDETNIDTTISSVNGYPGSTLAYMTQINTHSYSGSNRSGLKSLAQRLGKRLWQSECGPLSWPGGNDNDVAIFMAGAIIKDIKDMQPVAWIDWQVVDGGVWGTIHATQSSQTFTLAKRFYMHSNFSRFIRPGSVFIDANNSNIIAAQNQQKTSLTIVILNSSSSVASTYTVDLSAFSTIGNAATVYRTSVNEDLVKLSDITISSKRFTANVPAYSITTYQIPTAQSGSTPTPGVRGDVNGDNNVNIVDALLIAQSYVGLNPAGFNAANADVNCSGGIDIVDALLIAQYYVGLITSLPC